METIKVGNKVFRKATDMETREIQIELLDVLHEYCTNHGLQYFIIAGTLLGAVRHHGYIPWDDDIDVVMMRNDYDTLIRDFKSSSHRIISSETADSYPLPFAKLEKLGTYTEEGMVVYKDILGINIDIFPVDFVPSSKEERERIFKKNNRLRWLLDQKGTFPTNEMSTVKRLEHAVFQFVSLPLSLKKIMNMIRKNATSTNASDTDKCAEVVWGCGEREVVSTDVFSDSVELQFEEKTYKAPKGWDKWLSSRYGDYMKLPPIEQQVTHHVKKDYILVEKEN